MQPSTRALVAAAAYALINGKKVAGLYDHAAGTHRRIAAESRGGHLQGYDADRDARFGGSLPELFDANGGISVQLTIDGRSAQGYDRSTSGHFVAHVNEQLVQLYDHAAGTWFAFTIQVA